MILAGRRINDNMGTYVATEVLKLMTSKKIHVKDSRVLVLGLTFKENCPDLRNSKVVDVVRELEKFGAKSTSMIRGSMPPRPATSTASDRCAT